MKINLDAVSVLLVALAVGAVLYGLGYRLPPLPSLSR
jgi:hypothetical protein